MITCVLANTVYMRLLSDF